MKMPDEPSAVAARVGQGRQRWLFWPLPVFVAVVLVALALLLKGGHTSHASQPPAVDMQQVTLPADEPVQDSLRRIAEASDISLTDLRMAAGKPLQLGLPDYAHGHLEGFLLPGTYSIVPGESADQVLSMMVDRFETAAQGLDLERRARALGLSAFEVVTTASLVEKETTSNLEQSRVTRVVYNRLAARMPLQLDSTLDYVLREETALPEGRDLRLESAYNTFRNHGLPPTPIGSPGLEAMKAALSPATGDYLYFNLASGERSSLFTASVQEYLRARDLGSSESGSVIDVLDGDSILVRIRGRTDEVRLIGVDAPEHGECYYPQSRAATTQWLQGKQVTLQFDENQAKTDGVRLFAYVYANKELINLDLIRRGFARERAYGHQYQLRSEFQEAQKKPWRQHTRLWGCP
jgi:cell division protein YceG involved in septum cleavage